MFSLIPFTHSPNFLQLYFFCSLLSFSPCTFFPDFPFLVFLVFNWQLLCYIIKPFFFSILKLFSIFVSFYFCSLWLLPYFCLLKQSLCFKCALLLSSDCSDPFLKWVVGSCDDKSSDAILFSLPLAAIASELKLEGEMERNLWWHKWAAVLLCFP